MELSKVIQNLTQHTSESLWLFTPELWLCATIVALLFARLFSVERWLTPFIVAILGCAAAFVGQWKIMTDTSVFDLTAVGRFAFFDGLLVYDHFTIYLRLFLISFAFLLLILMRITGVPDQDAASDVYPLILGSTLGMCIMASANHLLIVFLGVEMASVPSYALAGMLKGRRKSSEAALKYAVYGAGAAGVMLYGISLVSGVLGTAHLPTIAMRLGEVNWAAGGGEVMALALGGVMVMVGLAFKLSAVPFHFWCPDVFEGATAEVNAFLSVASKAAALALLVRVALGVGHIPSDHTPKTNAVVKCYGPMGENVTVSPVSFTKVTDTKVTDAAQSEPDRKSNADGLVPVRSFVSKLIAFIAVITCTFGNLAAYGQTNIKRLLAYSTIAHAGYMMMPVAAAIELLNQAGGQPSATEAIGSLLVYIATYLFMNLAAFAIVAYLRNKLRSEEIRDYAGLIRVCPAVTVCFVLVLLSLIGMPPLAGFAGKFLVFVSLAKAQWLSLLVIAALNTGLSLFYYLRVIKVMCIDPAPESRPPISFSAFEPGSLYAMFITVPVVAFGVLFFYLIDVANTAVRQML